MKQKPGRGLLPNEYRPALLPLRSSGRPTTSGYPISHSSAPQHFKALTENLHHEQYWRVKSSDSWGLFNPSTVERSRSADDRLLL